jgi:signal peptidase I
MKENEIQNSPAVETLPDTTQKEVVQIKKEVKKQKEKSFWRELLEFALIAVLIVVPFRIFIAQPYIVNGASMSPTFETDNYLIVDQLSYRFTTPARGSVIIFKYPLNTSWYFIKRVIGLPGETVTIKNGVVTITKTDGTKLTLNEPYVKFPKIENYTKTLGSDEYFVMGDNRLGSADSRIWGPLPAKDIVGRPILRLFPLTEIGVLPGDETGVITGK